MRRYDELAAFPIRQRENLTRCAAEVPTESGWHWRQCGRPRGHGIDGLLCRQHAAKMAQGRHVPIPPDNP